VACCWAKFSVIAQAGNSRVWRRVWGLHYCKAKVACALPAVDDGHASLFPSLPQFCKPIAIKSRRFSNEDKEFIASKTKEWLTNDIIEECRSPWRTQLVVTKPSDDGHVRKRLCFDYPQSTNTPR